MLKIWFSSLLKRIGFAEAVFGLVIFVFALQSQLKIDSAISLSAIGSMAIALVRSFIKKRDLQDEIDRIEKNLREQEINNSLSLKFIQAKIDENNNFIKELKDKANLKIDFFDHNLKEVQQQIIKSNILTGHINENLNTQRIQFEDMVKKEQARVVQLTEELNSERIKIRKAIISIKENNAIPRDFYIKSIFSPEEELCIVLSSHIKNKTAIDVGANRGDFSELLEKANLSVDLFEPLPDNISGLTERFKGKKSVRIHPFACSNFDGESALYAASLENLDADASLFSTLVKHPVFEGFKFDKPTQVQVRRLDSILAPDFEKEIGILKIDTEGQDLNVLKGASNLKPEVLIVEYWNKNFVFNLGKTDNDIDSYLNFIKKTDYPLHFIMWRGMGEDEFGFIEGAAETPNSSWGNIVFLRDPSMKAVVTQWAKLKYGEKRLTTASN